MIDELGFAGACRGLCQSVLPGEHIDQGGLPHIASADECEFGPVGGWTLFVRGTTNYIFGSYDLHSLKGRQMLPLRRMNHPLPHDTVVPDRNSAETKKEQVARMFDRIAPRYDLLNRFLSARIDLHWRKDALREMIPHAPKRILDVATGTADLALLAEKILHPDSIIGIDISSQMLSVGRDKIEKVKKSSSILLESGDAEAINHPDGSFDLVMVAYGIRNFQDLSTGLKEMFRVLRPGGKLLILEFSRPKNPIWRSLYQFYMKQYVPTVASWMGQDKKAYSYLDESARLFPERTDLVNILETAGYLDCTYKTYTGGICSRYLATRPL